MHYYPQLGVVSVFDKYLIFIFLTLVAILVFLKCKDHIFDFVLALFVGGAASEILKYFVDKPRPILYDPIKEMPLLSPFEGGSFPSSHTTIAFAALFFYLLVCHSFSGKHSGGGDGKTSFRSVGEYVMLVILIIGAIAIGILRLVVRAHYPIDVLAGIVLGFLVSLPFRYYDVSARRSR